MWKARLNTQVSRGLLVLAVILISGSIFPFQITWAAEPGLETSIAQLVIKSGESILEKDPLFEIIDFDQYILVPLNGLSAYFPYTASFNRESNLVTVTAPTTKRGAVIDLQNKKYVIKDEFRWPEGQQPPVSLNGEFYVSPALIEYLVDVKIEWNAKYQELTVTAAWMEKKPEAGEAADQIDTEETKPVYIEGPPFSIGAIRYELSWEYRKDEEGESRSTGSLKLRGDGRAGAWAISLEGEAEYESDGDTTVTPSLIRGKYNENNKLIIWGDADVYLENTLAQQRVRGILYMTPVDAFSRYLVPHTTISGPADPGDKVTLIVNGKIKGAIVVDKKSAEYCFTNVPLAINRLNIVKVAIEKPGGEQLITEQKIAASLRILESGTHSLMVTAGKYKKNPDDEEWSGEMAGFKTGHIIFDTISFDAEAVRLVKYGDDTAAGRVNYGSDTGIAFRFGQNMVCTLDWLVGGEETDLKQGGESSILYCLERGFIQGIIFYVNPGITSDAKVQADPGKGIRILGEIEISDRAGLVGKFETVEALEAMDEYRSLKDFDLKLVRKYGENLDNKYSIGLRHKIQEASEDDPFYFEDLRRVYFEQYHLNKRFSLNNYLAYDDFFFSDIFENETGPFIKSGAGNAVAMATDYVHFITDTLLFSLSTDYTREWGERQELTDWSIESDLQWVTPKMWAGGNYEVKYYLPDSAPFEPSSQRIKIWSKHFLKEYLTLDFNAARILMDNDYYTSGEGSLTYWLAKNSGQYYAAIGYNSPYQSREESQNTYKLRLIRHLQNGLKFKLELEKLYETIWDEEPEKVIRLSCSQAVGCGGGRMKTVKADNENISFISGLVYLDENGNRQYDRGEKLLPDIKMSLNGRLAVSDENGEYTFAYVEPDAYQLNFALKSLPADYTPVTGAKLLKIKENENLFFDFGLTMNGSISGRVYLDANGNGVYDREDKPLSWVELVLDKDKKRIFTGNDGTFYFENIPLGEHTLAVMEESIPKEMMLVGEKSFSFILTEDTLDVSDLLIRIVYKFRE